MKQISGYFMVLMANLLGLIPIRGARAVGRFIGWLLYSRRNRSREVARMNLQHVYPALSEDEREAMLRRVLLHTGMVGMEIAVMWTASKKAREREIVNIYNEHLFDEALDSPRGLLILAPHIGNWELLNFYSLSKAPMTAMYRPAKNPVFNEWMVKSRKGTGVELHPTNAMGVRALLKTLKKGGVVGILPDQEPDRRSGIHVPFMNRDTLTLKMPYDLIHRSGARVLMMAAIRRSGGGFDIHILKPDDEIYSPVAELSTAAMSRSIEEVVALAPDQYQWTYKRFKRQDERPGLYSSVP